MQFNFSKGKSFGEQAIASRQEAEMYSEGASIQRQRSISSSSNLNQELLQRVADKKYGGDIVRAAHHSALNPDEYRQEASAYMDSRQSGMSPKELKSEAAVNQHYKSAKLNIPNAPLGNSDIAIAKDKANFDRDVSTLGKEVEEKKQKTKFMNNLTKSVIDSNQSRFQQDQENQKKEFVEESEKWAITRVWDKFWQ